MLNGTTCPFCDSRSLRTVEVIATDRPMTILECPACEIAWQWPPRMNAETSRAYFDTHYAEGDGYADPEAIAARVEIEVEILNSLTTPGALLDIGGGTGHFIRAAARTGWAATGIDPAASPFTEARARMIRGNLADMGGSFDAVTLFDVVEHVEDFPALLAAAYERLNSGGLVLVETGNYQSIDRLRGGPAWWDYHLDHRWYLAPGVLERTLHEAGFHNIRVIPRVARPHWRREDNAPVTWVQTTKSTVRQLATEPIHQHLEERRAAERWPEWHFLPIFLIAANR